MEKAYAKSLKTWSKKWGDLIEKGEHILLYQLHVIAFYRRYQLKNLQWSSLMSNIGV